MGMCWVGMSLGWGRVGDGMGMCWVGMSLRCIITYVYNMYIHHLVVLSTSTSIILIQPWFETVWFGLVCGFENPNRAQTKTKLPLNRSQTKPWFGSIRSGSWFGPGSKRFKYEPWHP